jgi:hypothetical protein
MKITFLILVASLIIISCTEKQNETPQNDNKEISMLKEEIAKFIPVEIKYDKNILTDRENNCTG